MKGICFKESLFHSVVEGRKTQTRRIVKPQPDDSGLWNDDKFPRSLDSELEGFNGTVNETGESKQFKPRYKIVDIVYLKEPYRVDFENRTIFFKYSNNTVDVKFPTNFIELEKIKKLQNRSKSGFVNKLFVPKWIVKYFPNRIQITGVRCEKLQYISDKDCIKEGINYKDYWRGTAYFYENDCNYDTAQKAYASLINKINGKGTWESNAWVWAYDFKLINKSFDEILEENKDILKRLNNV